MTRTPKHPFRVAAFWGLSLPVGFLAVAPFVDWEPAAGWPALIARVAIYSGAMAFGGVGIWVAQSRGSVRSIRNAKVLSKILFAWLLGVNAGVAFAWRRLMRIAPDLDAFMSFATIALFLIVLGLLALAALSLYGWTVAFRTRGEAP